MNEQIRPTSSPWPTVLWPLLVLGAVGNTVASAAGADLTFHLLLGAITAGSATGLVALRLKARS